MDVSMMTSYNIYTYANNERSIGIKRGQMKKIMTTIIIYYNTVMIMSFCQ